MNSSSYMEQQKANTNVSENYINQWDFKSWQKQQI